MTSHTKITGRADGSVEVRSHPADHSGAWIAAFSRQGYEMVKCKVRGRVARMVFVLVLACATEGGEAPPVPMPDAPPSCCTGCPNRNDARCLRVSIPRHSWERPDQVIKTLLFEPTIEHMEFVLNSWTGWCDGNTDWSAEQGK